jgi:hypothetical protein
MGTGSGRIRRPSPFCDRSSSGVRKAPAGSEPGFALGWQHGHETASFRERYAADGVVAVAVHRPNLDSVKAFADSAHWNAYMII